MNDWTATQIKEIVRIEVEAERRLRDALRAEDHKWIERELRAAAKALELQAKEYERRLQDLNHAHAEAQRVLGIYLPRELYERAHQEVVDWQRRFEIRSVETENRIKSVELGIVNLPGGVKSLELGLAAQAGQQTGTNTTRSTAITIVALVIAAIGVLIGIFNFSNR